MGDEHGDSLSRPDLRNASSWHRHSEAYDEQDTRENYIRCRYYSRCISIKKISLKLECLRSARYPQHCDERTPLVAPFSRGKSVLGSRNQDLGSDQGSGPVISIVLCRGGKDEGITKSHLIDSTKAACKNH